MLIRVTAFNQCEISFGETLLFQLCYSSETSSKIIEMKSNIEIGDMYDMYDIECN